MSLTTAHNLYRPLLVARRKLGMKRKELSALTGIAKWKIRVIERGYALPSLPQAIKLSEVLDIPFNDLG